MDSKDLSNLFEDLKDGSCAVILGPEFFLMASKEENLIESSRDIIYNDLLKNNQYLAEDGFFYTSNENSIGEKKEILRNVQKFFRNLDVPPYYDLLAELPFYLAISLSPDDLLSRSLTSKNRAHDFISYKKGSGLYELQRRESYDGWDQTPISDLTVSPSPSRPLIFNFQGIYDDKDSLIFTYDSLFDFLFSIFQAHTLPLNLKAAISKASSFLFLGFGYHKWYLKIIFFILEKLRGDNETEKKAIFNFSDKQSQMVEFYRNQFQVRFFKESTVDFISSMRDNCKEILQPRPLAKTDKVDKKGKYKVIYFSSNPNQLNPLDFEEEFKKIKNALLAKNKQEEFETPEWIPAVTQSEMLKKINELKPNLVVISMHGSQDKGLMFKEEGNKQAPFAIDEFVHSIHTLTQNPLNKLECILFSCCHSKAFAEKTVAHIPYAIGIEGPIQDEAMPVFNDGFFDSLFSDRQIEPAYNMGKLLLERKSNLKENADHIIFFHKQ